MAGRTIGRAALVLAVLVACAAAPAPGAAQGPAVGEPDTPIAVDPGAARDEAIERRIRDILGQLSGYETVAVSVDSGVVTLDGEALDAAAVARLQSIVRRVEGVVALESRVVETTDVAKRLTPSMDRFLRRAEQAVAFVPLLLVALVAFVLVFSLGLLVAGSRRLWQSLAPNAFIAAIYRQVVRLAFAVAGLVVALDILNATALLGSILGAAGIVGLAIGFAVRDTVENFIASVMLSIRQPFGPFDLVEIEGDVGKVIRLTSRATILLSLDGNTIRVPNATVFKSRIVNFTRSPERRFTFFLGVDPGADLARLRAAAHEKLSGLPFVLGEPVSSVWIDGEPGDAANVRLCFAAWIDQTRTSFDQARGEAIRILRAFVEAEGATRPPPIQRVVTVAPEAEAAVRPAPSAHDLDEATIADLAVDEERALERMAESERRAAARPDLLARNPSPE